MYQPGLHIIAAISTSRANTLDTYDGLRRLINGLIEEYALTKLGEVYHQFTPDGYTAVVCLSESHISVHTWPEHQKVNLDIYLSNYLRSNNNTVQEIFDAFATYFEGTITAIHKINR